MLLDRSAFNGLKSLSFLELKFLERVLTDLNQMKVLFGSQNLFNLFTNLLAKLIKGATKLCFTRDPRVVIILFNTGLDKSAFPNHFFGKLALCLSVFSVFSAYSVFRFHLLMILI